MSQPTVGLHPEYEALRREYNDFRYHLPDALIEIDLDSFQVLYVNRQAEILFGFDHRDVAQGLGAGSLMGPGEFPRALALLQEYVGASRAEGTPYTRTGRQDIFEMQMRRKDGSMFPGEAQSSMVLDPRGVPVRMLTIIRDISHRR